MKVGPLLVQKVKNKKRKKSSTFKSMPLKGQVIDFTLVPPVFYIFSGSFYIFMLLLRANYGFCE
jgi:hypothetical protein